MSFALGRWVLRGPARPKARFGYAPAGFRPGVCSAYWLSSPGGELSNRALLTRTFYQNY